MSPTIPADQDNLQRTVLLATDNKNSVLAEVAADNTNPLAYSAYGHQSARHEVNTHLGFNGELHEAQTSWYLLGNGYRAYNPRLMRFHSPDSLSPFGKGGMNTYMYCKGEPVMNSDPTGRALLAFFRNVLANVIDAKNSFVGTYRARVAIGENPVIALVSSSASVNRSGNNKLLNTLVGTKPIGSSQSLPAPSNTRFHAKKGGLHSKVGGVPSSTPASGSTASNPGSSGGGPGGGYRSSSYEGQEKAGPTIWTRYPKEVKRDLSPASRERVKDIRDRKEPL
jgi:RHS repeat-associated protein